MEKWKQEKQIRRNGYGIQKMKMNKTWKRNQWQIMFYGTRWKLCISDPYPMPGRDANPLTLRCDPLAMTPCDDLGHTISAWLALRFQAPWYRYILNKKADMRWHRAYLPKGSPFGMALRQSAGRPLNSKMRKINQNGNKIENQNEKIQKKDEQVNLEF